MTEIKDLLIKLGVNIDATGTIKTQYRTIINRDELGFEVNVQPIRNNFKLVIITAYNRVDGEDVKIFEYSFTVNRNNANVFPVKILSERINSVPKEITDSDRVEAAARLKDFILASSTQQIVINDIETGGHTTSYGT